MRITHLIGVPREASNVSGTVPNRLIRRIGPGRPNLSSPPSLPMAAVAIGGPTPTLPTPANAEVPAGHSRRPGPDREHRTREDIIEMSISIVPGRNGGINTPSDADDENTPDAGGPPPEPEGLDAALLELGLTREQLVENRATFVRFGLMESVAGQLAGDADDADRYLAHFGIVRRFAPYDPDAAQRHWRGEGLEPIEAPDDPHRLARIIRDGFEGLVRHRGQFLEWSAARPSYRPVPEEDMRNEATGRIKAEFDRLNRQEQAARNRRDEDERNRALERYREAEAEGATGLDNVPEPPGPRSRRSTPPPTRKVSQRLVGDTLSALGSLVGARAEVEPPCWLGDAEGRPDPALLLSLRRQLLDLSGLASADDGAADHGSIRMMEPTPEFFSAVHLPFDYDPEARPPDRFFSFLDEVFDGDRASVDELQKWFAEAVRPRPELQAILLMIGASRAGKGVIRSILQAFVGPQNVASTDLATLTRPHGLQDLVGKRLIVLPDMRCSRFQGNAQALELLLAISGGDPVGINPKNKAAYTARLPGRLLISTNVHPEFNDQSHALANRLRPLHFPVSFAGREDPTLEARFTTPEALSGLLNWALDGVGPLRSEGFLVPESARPTLEAIADATDPLRVFAAEWLLLGDPEAITPKDEVYAAFLEWAARGNHKELTKNIFCGRLMSTFPAVRTRRVRGDERPAPGAVAPFRVGRPPGQYFVGVGPKGRASEPDIRRRLGLAS